MNAALPLPVLTALPAGPATPAGSPAAVLPATAAHGAVPAQGAAARFDQALQLLLGAQAAVLPQPGTVPTAALTPSVPDPMAADDTTQDPAAQASASADTALLASMLPMAAPTAPLPPVLPGLLAADVGLPGVTGVQAPAAQAAAMALPMPTAETTPGAPLLPQAAPPASTPTSLPASMPMPTPHGEAAPAAAAAAAGTAPAGTASGSAPTSSAPVAQAPLPALATANAPRSPADAPDSLVPTQASERPAAMGGTPQAMPLAPSAAPTDDAAPHRPPSLLDTLGERIALQMQRGSERVLIRLDPPLRGQIEILIRQDASGAPQVQLQASHGDVLRQLHAIGDSLRQELAQRHGGDVQVQIAQQPRDQDGRQRQERQAEQQQQPGRAWDEHDGAADTARFALAADTP